MSDRQSKNQIIGIVMKQIFLSLFLMLASIATFAQGYNSKEGSHRGYNSPYSQQQQQPTAWSGSGIALGPKIFATNNHVVEGASNLYVYFPETQKKYKAETITVDVTNDLAIVKVTDPSFAGFPSIKYGFKKEVEDVGMSVFVLGYPLIDTMGEEVKLTTGVVSSRSGFQGDKSQYQISAPVQPGNSGGPLFNERGELIGIVSAKHTGADNVSYGVKLSYLSDLAVRAGVDVNLNKSTQIASMSLSEKCKAVIPCTIMVLANNEGRQASGSQTASRSTANTPSPSSVSGGYPIHCNMPAISRKGDTAVEIYAIEVTSNYTAVYMSWTNTQYNPGWYNIHKDTYIVDKNTGKKYPLMKTENCEIAPKKTNIAIYDTQEFVLYFPALPSNVSLIDLCEPSTSSSWKFYGIKIR